eukprot:GEMP01002594.1.p1 GENE.GEMP01002594.1~~GEMP01002594.1.p1  ORF type:complete len:748 (+),score=103.72 GEMP01002594.1:333-2576(+)
MGLPLEDFLLEVTALVRRSNTARCRGKGAHTRAAMRRVSLTLSDTKLIVRGDRVPDGVYRIQGASVVRQDLNRVNLNRKNERLCGFYFEEPQVANIFHDAVRRKILRSLRECNYFHHSKEDANTSLLGTVFTSDAFNQVLANEQLSADCLINLEGVSKSFFRIFAHNPVRWQNVEIATLRQAATIAAYHGELMKTCHITMGQGPFHKSYFRDLSYFCPHLEELRICVSPEEFLEAVVSWMPRRMKRLSISGGRLHPRHMASSVVDKLPAQLRSLHVSPDSGFMNLLLTTGIHSVRPDLVLTSIINCFGVDNLPVYPFQATLRLIIGCIYTLWQSQTNLTNLAVWALGTTLSSPCFSDPPVELLVEANEFILCALENNTDTDVLRLGTYCIFLVFRRSLLQQGKGKAVVEAAVRQSRVIEILSKLAQLEDYVTLRNAICNLDLVAYCGIEAWVSKHVPMVAEVAGKILLKFPAYHGDLNQPSMEHLHAHQILQRLRSYYPAMVPPQSLPCQHLEKQKIQWLKGLRPHDVIDAMDTEQAAWYESFVVQVDLKKGIQVHFLGWNPSWRRWIPYDEPFRVQKRNIIVPRWRPKLQVGDKLDVKIPLAQIASRKAATIIDKTVVIPQCTQICLLEEEGDASLRPRWKAAMISMIQCEDEELTALVHVSGMPVIPPPELADVSDFTFGRLLDFGLAIEFWVDLNGNGVMPYGTHTQKLSTKRPVWSFLPMPKLPHMEHEPERRWKPYADCVNE